MRNRERDRALDALQIAAWRGGDVNALRAIMERRGPVLLAHARRLCDDIETAKDIAQSAWMEIWKALPRLSDDAAFLAFALRIVTRLAARDLGQRLKHRRGTAAFALFAAPEAPMIEAETGLTLKAVLLALAPEDRALLYLALIEELSGAELALALDIPAGTVKSRLHHLRARLRQSLLEIQDEP